MNIIKRLKERGLTKWKISKLIGVSWQTVHNWEKESFKPTKDKLEKLELLDK